MKLSFTTLGCPDWDLPTIIAKAREYGYDGIDFRGYGPEMAVYRLPEFAADGAATAQRLAEAGLELTCFSSGAGLLPAPNQSAEEAVAEVQAYAALCPTFGTPFIRVFGKDLGPRGWPEAIDTAAETLGAMIARAGEHGVRVLVETHDAWVRSEHLLAVLERFDPSQTGVVWDIHHPWRHGEAPASTCRALGPWIAYTHWKDAGLPDHDLRLMGAGDLPLAECFAALQSIGYDGCYTLEWEKRWHPEIAGPEVALPDYVAAMRRLEADHA